MGSCNVVFAKCFPNVNVGLRKTIWVLSIYLIIKSEILLHLNKQKIAPLQVRIKTPENTKHRYNSILVVIYVGLSSFSKQQSLLVPKRQHFVWLGCNLKINMC